MSVPALRLNSHLMNSMSSQVSSNLGDSSCKLGKCRSPEGRRPQLELTSRGFEREQEKVTLEAACYSVIYLPIEEIERGVKMTLTCHHDQTQLWLTKDRIEVEKRCVKQGFAYRLERDKQQAAVAVGADFSRPFSIVVQSLAGKLRPSCVSTILSTDVDSLACIQPYRLVEQSLAIRKLRLQGGTGKRRVESGCWQPEEGWEARDDSFQRMGQLRKTVRFTQQEKEENKPRGKGLIRLKSTKELSRQSPLSLLIKMKSLHTIRSK